VDPASRIVYVDNDPVVSAHARAQALSPGSYLAIAQAAPAERWLAAQRRWNQLAPLPVWLRDREEVASWLPRGIPVYGAGRQKIGKEICPAILCGG
jgi:hypothetical protein